MTKQEEKNYFDKEWTEMKAGLKSFLSGGEQEDLHRFRVQVKKLQAFLFLLEHTGSNHKLKRSFNPVRKIFKRAGEIRKAFINQEVGKTMKVGQDDFTNRQLQQQLKITKKFKSKKGRFVKDLNDSGRVLRKKLRPVSDLHISLFYQDQLHKIAAFLEKLKFNEQLHECRKMVKILLYNYKPAHVALGTGLNEDYLDKVQTAIGDWHDHIMALNSLSGDKSMIDETTQKSSGKLRRKISVLTKDFYNRATTTVELPLEQIS